MVRDEVLKRIKDPDLRVYAVWEKILRSDNERAARKATTLLPDKRVTHFWAPSEETAHLFGSVLPVHGSAAWDVYLVYPPDQSWTDIPPVPERYMHQLTGRLPDELMLDGDSLATWVAAAAAKP